MDEHKLVLLKKQANTFKQTLFQHLLQYQFIEPDIIATAVSTQLNIPIMALDKINYQDVPNNIIPLMQIKNQLILPIEKNEGAVTIAIANPEDRMIEKMLSFQLKKSIQFVVVRYDILTRLHNAIFCNHYYTYYDEKNGNFIQALTHHIFSDAIHRSASDMHFEPYQSYCRIRFRLDGLLHTILTIPTQFTDALISCIKVLAHLDIAIKRTPQDGRLTFRTHLGFYKDCRVSTCPTQQGEKIVIRLLDANTEIRPINQLGLNETDQNIILNAIKKPQGLILVTGPTGSGKTITLYTLLNLLNEAHRNIATVEDPIEMQIDGINQTNVNVKNGLTFSTMLRTLLRQDPDVIMIGEIRDQETAEMALRAAQTGHLVLSTLHTNSAADCITRLTHMNIAPFHLCSALTLIIAQRLVRKRCLQCESGCTYCTGGYQGRVGIFELMPITESMKTMIANHASSMELAKHNYLNGHVDLWESALQAVKQWKTSMEEIYRVIPEK